MKTRSMRIVVLDDEPLMLKALLLGLRQLGYEDVFAAQGATEALQQIDTAQPGIDLIMLDLNLPGMDGIQLIRELVKSHYGGSVILVSGESARTLHSAERLLATQHITSLGHLHKPVTIAALRSRLVGLRPNLGRVTANGSEADKHSVAALRTATSRRQFINFYQPKVSLATGEVVGVECLVRWQHPIKGLVSPNQFIGLAEERGIISAITRLVVASALEQAVTWQRGGHCLPIAVNVSMEDLSDLDFPDNLGALVRNSGLDPAMITLEITEGRLMGQFSTVLEVLNRLRLKRFKLAMDDFGTGHSSLAQLRDLPFDELKVDRTFVRGAAADATLRAICRASLRMAHQLKMEAVAEGVEDQSDWECARQIGFDVAQGYLLGRPMPAHEVMPWLARRNNSMPVHTAVPA